MAKLNEFISQVKNVGLSRSNRYSVLMTPPPAARVADFGDLRQLLLFCDQVQLPGINLSTTQNRTFGEFREVPYEKLFGDVNMSFYVDTSLYVKSYFDNWMGAIQDPLTRNFEYYRNYITDMIIDVEDLNDEVRYSVKLFECYPKTISPVQMDYANKDIMKLSVTMQYKYWIQSEKVSTSDSLDTNEQILQDFLVPEQYYNDFKKFQTNIQEVDNVIDNPVGSILSRYA